MFCKVKLTQSFFIYDENSNSHDINGQTLDAWLTESKSIIILSPKGYISYPSNTYGIEVLKEEPEAKELPLSGLRALIGQDMKHFAVEFK